MCSVRSLPATITGTKRGDMRTMTYTEPPARNTVVLDGVVDECEEIVITRAGHEPPLSSPSRRTSPPRETGYLLHSPANARHLLSATELPEAGRGTVHDLATTTATSSSPRAATPTSGGRLPTRRSRPTPVTTTGGTNSSGRAARDDVLNADHLRRTAT